MRIIIFYDPNICNGCILAKHFMQHTMKEFQTTDKDGKPYLTRDRCHIDFLNSRIDFLPIYVNMRGLRAEICLIPNQFKNSSIIKEFIYPMMRTNFIGYYDQELIK